MEIEYYFIAGGNKTALVYGGDPGAHDSIARDLLGAVEQVGFVSMERGTPKLTMMGHELCVDAMLAFASTLAEGETFLASGVVDAVLVCKAGEYTEIDLVLPHRKIGDIVLFDGIGYLSTPTPVQQSKDLLRQYALDFGLPAFGVLEYRGAHMTPTVYVARTDSYCTETACGSGSIALCIVTNEREITQPTGHTITVTPTSHGFMVGTKVDCAA